jgi:uncharacterized repeat protein (TIGR03803 family)
VRQGWYLRRRSPQCSASTDQTAAIRWAWSRAGDGNFYGTTQASDGTIFKITPGGTLTTQFTLDGLQKNSGESPEAGLIQGIDGNFYGTTSAGGANGDGTVFKITPSGTLTTLHSFDGTDGFSPIAGLIQGTDGNFYGTTQYGGANSCTDVGGAVYSCGTIFKITPSGLADDAA